MKNVYLWRRLFKRFCFEPTKSNACFLILTNCISFPLKQLFWWMHFVYCVKHNVQFPDPFSSSVIPLLLQITLHFMYFLWFIAGQPMNAICQGTKSTLTIGCTLYKNVPITLDLKCKEEELPCKYYNVSFILWKFFFCLWGSQVLYISSYYACL